MSAWCKKIGVYLISFKYGKQLTSVIYTCRSVDELLTSHFNVGLHVFSIVFTCLCKYHNSYWNRCMDFFVKCMEILQQLLERMHHFYTVVTRCTCAQYFPQVHVMWMYFSHYDQWLKFRHNTYEREKTNCGGQQTD